MNNSVRRLVFSLGIATLLVAFILHYTRKESSQEVHKQSPYQVSQPPPADEAPPVTSSQPLLGDQLLAQYGSPSGTLTSDMELFDRYLDNVFILIKQRDPRYYATNEDLVLFLTGQKGNLTPYLSPDSPLLNDQGQILDRFGSPLIVHPLSKDQIEIRSAGPDQAPYTEDDVIQ